MALRTAAKFAASGCVLKPLLINFFMDPANSFDFSIPLASGPDLGDRPHDGWFHSSTHPSLTEAELVAYLTVPQKRTAPTYVGRMSMLFGTLTHGVVRSALNQMGVTVPVPPGPCPVCHLPRVGRPSCEEHAAIDPSTHSRGHLDGILKIGKGYDLKTIKMYGSYGLKDAPDMDLAYFMATWPKYYAQAQDYMRLTGLREFIVLFMVLGNPWEFREYHIPYDSAYCLGIETRYKNALRQAGMKL